MGNHGDVDVAIIGAGAAGLMCALTAGARGRRVVVIEHTNRIAEKIRISGGGRCNFTNIHCAPDRYLSQNPHFCRSALKRYTQYDFITMVSNHGIPFHEKTLGQLFCDDSARDIIDMLVDECIDGGVDIQTETSVHSVERDGAGRFILSTSRGVLTAQSLVIACGGLSIPKIGATPFGYEIARQFGLHIVPTRAGLVPLMFDPAVLSVTKELSGVSIDPAHAYAQLGNMFEEAMLFTHRGISGPVILQISSYWQPGEDITINMHPGDDVMALLKKARTSQPKAMLHTVLGDFLPKRLAQQIADEVAVAGRMADLSDKVLGGVADRVARWRVKPSGSEGYKTAEVTLGGVDTNDVSSKTFESNAVPGLYFVGEVLDVTGHLGGYNFQWAWSSGHCAGQVV